MVGKIHEDEFMIHRLIDRCKRISVVSDKLYYYVQRQGSIIQQGYSLKKLDAVEAILERSKYFIGKRYFNYAFLNLKMIPYALSEAYVKLDIKEDQKLKLRYKKLKSVYNRLKLQCCLAGNVGFGYRIMFFIKDIIFNINAKMFYCTVPMGLRLFTHEWKIQKVRK